MNNPPEKPRQPTEELEQQVREQVERDPTGQHKPEIDRIPGLTEQQQDEQREREQDVHEIHEKRDDGSRVEGQFPPPNPD